MFSNVLKSKVSSSNILDLVSVLRSSLIFKTLVFSINFLTNNTVSKLSSNLQFRKSFYCHLFSSQKKKGCFSQIKRLLLIWEKKNFYSPLNLYLVPTQMTCVIFLNIAVLNQLNFVRKPFFIGEVVW